MTCGNKCKEMCVNFMKNSITAMRTISVGNQEVERVGRISF